MFSLGFKFDVFLSLTLLGNTYILEQNFNKSHSIAVFDGFVINLLN